MIKRYRFLVNTESQRIVYDKLESIPRVLRGEYIVEAIRALISQNDSAHPPKHPSTPENPVAADMQGFFG